MRRLTWVAALWSTVSAVLSRANNSVFHGICVAHGLNFETPRAAWLRLLERVLPTMNLVLCMCLILFFPWKCFQSATNTSFMDIASISTNFTFVAAGFYAALIFAKNPDEIRSLLEPERRVFRHVLFLALCSVPLIVHLTRRISSTSDSAKIILYILVCHSEFVMISFFIVYNDIIVHLALLNQEISEDVRRTDRDLFSSIAVEWDIRDRIGRLNSMFASLLSWYYVQFRMIVMHTLAVLAGLTPSAAYSITMLFVLAGISLPLFELSRSSTHMTSVSLQTEYLLSKRFFPESPVELLVLRFREDLDVPRVGVFSQGIPNLSRFFGFCITCSAVILQFDYKMLRKIWN